MNQSPPLVLSPVEALERRTMLAVTAVGGWTPLAGVPKTNGLTSDLNLKAFKPFRLATGSIARSLSLTPTEDAAKYGIGRGAGSRLIRIPTPDGDYHRFRIVESGVMAPALAAQFAGIKTYAGVGVDDPSARIRLDFTPAGFHAQVLTRDGDGAYYVDPYFKNDRTVYASYYRADNAARGAVHAGHDDIDEHGPADAPNDAPADASTSVAARATAARASGGVLRTYRLAVAATAEYTAYFGGTVAAGQAAIVTAINRVTGIYESELAIRLQLVAGNSSLVFTDTTTDGYTNESGSAMLGQNQAKIDAVLGNANYDIGHVFSTGGGGIASMGVVGNGTMKARGVTGSWQPTNDGFWVDYVAHEIGHQFGANHTFNTAKDQGNRKSNTAYEPGSGSTIMAYAGVEGTATSGLGVTGPEDLQAHSDPYFAFASIDEILNYVDVTRPNCGTRTPTGNSAPAVSGGADYVIPANTPFALTAAGSDADGDTIYYSWEQADRGAARYLSDPDNGSSPLFRVYKPTTSPTRTFPQLPSILNGSNVTYVAGSATSRAEQLPTTNRTMKFVVTARDQKPGGGGTVALSASPVSVTSVAAASTFAVSNLNGPTVLTGGSPQTINWDVAGTTGNGINTSAVRILMSTDGGQTFATVLAADTPNDGSETVMLPNGVASMAVRFKVAAVGNIYFDINNADLTLVPTAAGASAVPGVPDLLSDTGASDSDDLTNLNNSVGRPLTFAVGGTAAGALVTLYADGVAVGAALATGDRTTVTTSGLSALADGRRAFTATQAEAGKTASAPSAALAVTIDTVAPAFGTAAFSNLVTKPQVTFAFSEPVTPAGRAFGVTRSGSGDAVAFAASAAGAAITLTFPDAPSGILGNGNYTAAADGRALTDAAGNMMAGQASLNFFVLAGDANGDRTVDFTDFLALQSGFGGAAKTFATGDFNYDGVVDFDDFLILQANLGTTV